MVRAEWTLMSLVTKQIQFITVNISVQILKTRNQAATDNREISYNQGRWGVCQVRETHLLIILLEQPPQEPAGGGQHDLVALDSLARGGDQLEVHQAGGRLQAGQGGVEAGGGGEGGGGGGGVLAEVHVCARSPRH